ncbi:MAG: hypothetical protein R2746_15635 [Acidimicrobiales bacterium]
MLAMLLLAGELAARALGPFPADRTWPDLEAQAKAEHAAAVAASGEREQIVFAGSSIADAAFDPAVVVAGTPQVTAYSYAQEGSAAATAADFLEAVVLPRVHPDLVVLGLTPNEVNDGGRRQRELEELQRDSRGFRVAAGTPTVADRIDTELTSRSALLAHREVLRNPYRIATKRGTTTTSPWNDPETGALLRHRDLTYEPPPPATGDRLARQDAVWGDFSVGGHQLDAVRRLARRAGEDGAAVVVVELPVFRPGFLAQIPDGQDLLDRTHRALVALEDEGCVVRLDLRDQLQDERYWSDPVHVNGAGTEAISEAVGAWLADLAADPATC